MLLSGYTKVTWGGVTAKPAEAYGESYYGGGGNDWEDEQGQQQYGGDASSAAYAQSPYQDDQGYGDGDEDNRWQ